MLSDEKAVVLLSGGIDSALCLDIAVEELGAENVWGVHVNYGQMTETREYTNAQRLAGYYSILHECRDLKHLSGGTTEDKDYDERKVEDRFGQSVGYVPMRNLQLLTLAGVVAEEKFEDKLVHIYHGAQGGDQADYPDCREEFFQPTELAMRRSTQKNEIEVKTPLINSDKTEVILNAEKRGVPLQWTFSCYNDVEGEPCGKCPACQERTEAFEEAGLNDPIQGVKSYGKNL